MNNLKIVIGLVLLMCWNGIKAQNIEQDLKQLYKTYEKLTHFSSTIKVYIQSAEGANFELFQEGKVRKNGKEMYVQMGELVHLQNERCKLTINHEHQQMGYIEFTEADKMETESVVQSFEEILKQQDISKFVFIATKNGQKHYRLVQPDNMIAQMELYLNEQTFLLEKLVYSYNEELIEGYQKVRIEYRDNNLQPKFKKGQFSENTFLKKANGKIILRPNYAQYSLSTFKNEPTDEK